MVALLHDLSVREHDDIVGVLNGGKAVGNDEHRTNVHHLFERVLNELLGLGVNVCGRFVQNHDLRLVHDGSGKGEQLALTGREVVTTLQNLIIQSLFQFGNKGICVDVLAGIPDLFVADAFLTQQNVLANGTRKQEHVLQHLSKVAAQRCDLDLFYIDTVNENLTLLNVVVAADEREDGGLARARRANECNRLLGLNGKGDVLEHPFTLVVGKPYVLKLDLTLYLGQINGILAVHNNGLHIHNGKDLLCRGKRRLQPVELLGKVLYRVEELGDIHVEGNDYLTGNDLSQNFGVVDHTLSTQEEERKHRGLVKDEHHRAEDTKHKDLFVFCAAEGGVLLAEFLQLFALTVEELRDLNARKVFGKEGVNVGGAILHTAVCTSGEFAEDNGKQNNKGNKAQHHQGEHIIEAKHCYKHTENNEYVFDEVDDNVGEHHRNAVGVVCNTGNELAHGNVVELLVRKLFNVLKEIKTDVGNDLLSDFLQGNGLQVGAHHCNNKDAGVKCNSQKQGSQFKIRLLDVALNVTDEVGADDVVRDGKKHQRQHKSELCAIGLGVNEQAFDDLLVRDVTVKAHRFFFVLNEGICNDEDDGKDAQNAARNDKRIVSFKYRHIISPPPISAALP